MKPKLTFALSLHASLLALVLSILACEGAEDSAATTSPGSDASADALYSGGGSVIPSSTIDGASGGGTTYGYGSLDGSTLSPCPRDGATLADVPTAPGEDAGPALPDGAEESACASALGPGDLIIDELMIASQSGAGDHGEWLEVQSTRDCVIDLDGLFAEVPHGKGTTIASITGSVMLAPHGFFLIADSDDPAVNHDLPGMVFVWGSGTSSDVLLNSGDAITLYTATATIDTLTYPDSSKLVDAASMAFPADCAPSLRLEFGNWQPSIASWTPGFFGTPMAPNTDVSCPVAPPPPPSTPCGG